LLYINKNYFLLIQKDSKRKNNKAWSTKPTDITDYCKKKKGGSNNTLVNEVRFLSTFISSKVIVLNIIFNTININNFVFIIIANNIVNICFIILYILWYNKWKDFVVQIIICEYLSLTEAVNSVKQNFISKEDLLRQSKYIYSV